MKKTCLAFMIIAFLAPSAFASVGGIIQGGNPPSTTVLLAPCGSTGTLYTNLTKGNMQIELSLTNSGACSMSFSWTDAEGQAQSIDIDSNASTVFSTSLRAGGELSWASPTSAGPVTILWELEQPPSQSVGVPSGFNPDQLLGTPCGSMGTLYKNLTRSSITINLGMTNSYDCEFALSWTDTAGRAQKIDLGLGSSQGFSTTLPPSGVITWTAGSGSGPISAGWRLERVVSTLSNEQFEEKGKGNW